MRWIQKIGAATVIAAWVIGSAWAQDVPADQDLARRAIHVCASCHGEAGLSPTTSIPSLAGQMPQYMITQLKDFRSERRAEAGTRAYMWGVSALLDDATIVGLANYYAAQTPAKGKPGKPELVTAGRKIFVEGIPARNVVACASCHGERAEGAAAFPRLAGQHADYLYAQLVSFSGKLRPHGVVMQRETQSMTKAEMRAVAAYLQSL